MRKILSVVLVVVMLAAMATVFPTSAASTAPDIVISEVNVKSLGLNSIGATKDTNNDFEFIEIYNAGATDINLYDYSMVRGDAVDAGEDPATKAINRITPIQRGTAFSGNYKDEDAYWEEYSKYYPTNPETAILKPGQVAVIWFCNAQGYAVAKAANSDLWGVEPKPLTEDDFRDRYRIKGDAYNDILVLAVDAYSAAKKATIAEFKFPDNNTAQKKLNITAPGVNNATLDINGLSPRFNLADSGMNSYGIMKTEDIVTEKDLDDDGNLSSVTIKSTMSDCISYVLCNYKDADVTKNMAHEYNKKYMLNNTAGVGSAVFDLTYNFKYHTGASKYVNGKTAASNVKYGDWDTYKYATPGFILPEMAESLKTLGSTPPNKAVYIWNIVETTDESILYTLYQQNFFGIADSTDSDAVLAAIGWEKTYSLSNGGTVRYSIENETLIADNLDIDKDGNYIDRSTIAEGDGSTKSADALVKAFDSLKMEKIARSNYTVEYDITYLDAQQNKRYSGFIYNFNDQTSYDILIIRVNGTGNNQRRVSGGTYETYDAGMGVLSAPNSDANETSTSIINKITGGAVKVNTTTDTNIPNLTYEEKKEYAPMLGRTLAVRIEVNQVTGPECYINNILVSKARTVLTDPDDENSAVAANLYWGAQTNYNEFAIGFFVSNRVKAAIDNIRVVGYINEYTENDMMRTYDQAELKEPATGDATIYVVIAMAVSFISLATLVIAKRRRNEN